MWTEPLPNGKFKAVERYTDPITGKQKKISVTIPRDTRTARKEAQGILDQKIEAILGKTDYDNMTFGELCERYIESLSLKPSSIITIKKVIRRLKEKINPLSRINALNAAYISDCLKDEQPVRYNTCINRFKTIMRYGYSHDYVKDISWIAKIQSKKDNRKARIEDKYLEQSELNLLLKNMTYKNRLMTQFLVLSGLRIGEALALTKDDVDTTYIHVTKTVDIITGDVFDTPKTTDSIRDVFIQPELAGVIKEIRKWRMEDMMKRGYRTDLLFSRISYSAYRQHIRKHAKEVLGKNVTPHTLRHTHASLLAASGMSLEAIARRLGHADSDITKEVYLHVTEKLRKKEEAQLSKVKFL